MTERTTSRTEIVVIGGGMVGAAIALGLAQVGFDVAVVEQAPPPPLAEQPACQVRVSALVRASEHLLQQLGVWRKIADHSAWPFRAMRVWSEDASGEVIFRAEEIGEPDLGHVVPNRVIQAALWEALKAQHNVTLLTGTLLSGWQTHATGLQVQLEDGRRVDCRLLIGADGARSIVRQKAFIPLDSHEYGQAAIVGCVRTERSHEDTCWQRYTAEGPVAFLAMRENVSSLAWYLSLEKLQWALSLSDEAFAEALTQASGERLGRIVEVGARAGFPLVRRHARQYVKGRVVLAGDAAHTVHPQAGQGVNLGFMDAAALIEVLSEARSKGMPWDHPGVLQRYERRRIADNLIVQRAMDGFDTLFAQDLPWKWPLRQGVIRLAQSLSPLRQIMMASTLYGRGMMPSFSMNRQHIDRS